MAVVFSERTQPVDLDAVKAVDAVQRYGPESGRPLVSAQEHEQLCELFDEVLVPALIEPTPEASVSEHAMAELARALQLGAECAQHELASLLESAQISLQQQLSSEQSAKASALEDAQRVRSERDAANTRAESLSKERDQHRDESRRKDAELERWHELAQGRTESGTSGQSDDDDNDVASLKRAVQQARDEMDGYQRIYAEQQHYVDGLEAQVHRLQAQLDGEPDGYGGLAQENEELCNADTERERDLTSKGSELSSHRERVHSLESHRAQSMSDAQEKQAEIDRLQLQLQERKEPDSEPGVQEETVKGRLAHLEVENAAEEEQQLSESNVKDVRSDSELQHVHKQHCQLSEPVEQTQLESQVLCSHAGYGPDEEVEKQHLRSKIDDEQAEKEAERSEVEALRSDTSLSDAAQSSAELRMRAEKAERALNKALSREASERKQKLDTEDRLSELSRVHSQRVLTLDNAAERAETCAQKLENDREQLHAVPWETCRSVCDEQLQLKEAMADADVQQARKRHEAAEIRALDAEDGAEISDTLLYQNNARRRSELHTTRNNSHTRQQQSRADQHHDEHGCSEMNQEAEHRRREDRDDKQAEVDRLKDELESTRAQVLGQPHRGTEVAKRKLQMQQKDKKIAQLREAVKELEKKYAEALKEKSDADMRESAAESARHLQKQVASLQGKLRSANASLEQSKERERSLEHQRQRFERHAASLPSNEQLRALQQRQHDLQQQNHSLAHQLHQVKEQMQDARASGGGARDKAHQQQQQEQTWQPQIASYSKENAKLRKRVESLRSKLSSSEQEHQAAKQHVNKLQERIDRLEREKQPSSARQQAQQQQQRKQQPSSGPASSARALHEENERLNAELAERQKREGEGHKVKRLEEELQKLREKRIEMSANEASQEVQELHDANFDKESVILQLRFECEQQRAKAERLENRIEELFRSKEGGSDSSSRRPPWNPGREQELEEVVHGLRRVVERLRGENASLRQRANPQKSEQQSRLLQEARERASELEDERDGLKQRVAEVEDENRRLVQDVSSGLEKDASSEDNETRKRELEAQVQQEQEEAERKRHEVQCLGDELEQLRIEHAKTLEELREMQQQHGREGGEKNGLEDKAVEAVAEEPEGGESEVSKREELEQENADLRAELDALSPSFFQEVAELKRSHEQQAEMLSRYEAQLQELAAEQGREFTPLRRPGAESKSEGR